MSERILIPDYPLGERARARECARKASNYCIFDQRDYRYVSDAQSLQTVNSKYAVETNNNKRTNWQMQNTQTHTTDAEW